MKKVMTKETHPKEYEALETTANLLTALSRRGTRYIVEDTYFDFGQNWRYTTVIAYRKDGASWQALSASDHDLVTDIGTLEAIAKAVENTVNSKFNPDKEGFAV